jgi:hypothetical protein
MSKSLGLGGVAFVVALAGSACNDSASVSERVNAGTPVTVGLGTARTEIRTNPAGAVTSFDVVLTEAALSGLPAGMSEFMLPLPVSSAQTPFNHVTLNWNPGGHPPPGIYDTPHFDVHYYMITTAQRAAIAPSDPQFAAKATRAPAAEAIPVNYVGDPFAIPNMGTHWWSTVAPERNGQPVTHTFIYGFYDAAMIFFEPMFTRAFLLTGPTVTTDIAMPARFQTAGRYPSRYSLNYDAARKEYRIELGGFVARN